MQKLLFGVEYYHRLKVARRLQLVCVKVVAWSRVVEHLFARTFA